MRDLGQQPSFCGCPGGGLQPSTSFVVPATVPDYGWTWTEAQPLADARERIQIMIEFSRAMGLTAQGEVRDSDDPVEIVRQVLGDARTRSMS